MTSIEKVRVFQFKAPKRRMQKIRQFLSALVVGTGLLALSNGAVAQSVTGEITDPGRSIAFPGAIVRIEGLPGSTTSDERGRFRLGNVPAGSHTLIVSYVGTEDTTISIEVTEDGVDLGEVVIGATAQASLEEIIVFGQAAAFASALNQERSAHNLVSVLDTDAIGAVSQASALKPTRARGVTSSFEAWTRT